MRPWRRMAVVGARTDRTNEADVGGVATVVPWRATRPAWPILIASAATCRVPVARLIVSASQHVHGATPRHAMVGLYVMCHHFNYL